MQNKHPPTERRKRMALLIASYAGIVVAAIAFVCVLAILIFPDPLVNRFVKPRITTAFSEAYPAYSIRLADMNYSFFKNRFEFDSVALRTADGTFSGTMGPFSVSGIDWKYLLWGGKLGPKDFELIEINAQDITLNFPQTQYELRCQSLRISVPDSEIVVQDVKFNPLGDDKQYFAESKLRKTRFRLVVPEARVMGLASLELIKGENYRTRSVFIRDPFLDVLINIEKPGTKDTLSPPMPEDIFSSIMEALQVDSLRMANGRLRYGEKFASGSKPALITFDSLQVSAEGIAKHADRNPALVIHAQGNFIKSGTIKTLVSIPFTSTKTSFAYSGLLSRVGWMRLLREGTLAPSDIMNSVVDIHPVVLNFPQSQYELRCERLRISVPDSQVVVDALKLYPKVEDEVFFANSKFRKTRFRLDIPYAKINGLACLELLQGKNYRISSARIDNMLLDVLINKDKSHNKDTLSPPMPNKILSSIRGILQVDRLNINNGRLRYGERFGVGSKPAVITFDSMQVLAEGIANHSNRGAPLVIHAQGKFMKAGTMKVFMSFPLASTEFSYQYSGSLSGMDLTALNSFLETAEQIRIKAGVLQTATFEIDVTSGNASGNVRAVYKGLTFAVLNKETGSSKGFFNQIASFIANTFKINGTNVPSRSGSVKLGEVKYKQKRDEFFMEFTWFALRSGLGDVVGF